MVCLNVIIFANLNGLFNMIFGIDAPLSVLILILSLVVIYLAIVKFGVSPKFGPFLLLVSFFTAYLYFGQVALLIDSSALHNKTSLLEHYRRYISTVIIISAYFLGYVAIKKNDPNFNILKNVAPYLIFTTAFVVLSSVFGLTSIYEYGKDYEGDRNIGFFGNPNEAGAFACYTLSILFSLLLVSRSKLLLLLLIFGTIFVAISTFSKAAFFTILVLIVLFLFYSLSNFFKIGLKAKFITIAFILSSTISVFLILNNLSTITKQLSLGQMYRVMAVIDLLEGNINETSASERDVLWIHALEIIPNRIIFGHGLGTFHRLNSGPKRLGVHNTFLMIVGESGIFVLLLFIIALFSIWKMVKFLPYHTKYAVTAILIVFVFNELMTNHNALGLRYSNALTGLVLALIFINRKIRSLELN